MNSKLLVASTVGVALLSGAAMGTIGIASAASTTTTQGAGMMRGMFGTIGERSGVFGKVTAVNGTTLVISSQRPDETTATTYTVNIANATIKKFTEGAPPATISAAQIAVGDSVGVKGTVSGTSVTATEVMDGMPARGEGKMRGPGGHGMGHGTVGTVSAISGNTITLTGKDGKTYTVDAANAKISKMVDLSVGDVKVGDTLGVEGTVNGTSITAAHIMDGVPPMPPQGAAPAQQ